METALRTSRTDNCFNTDHLYLAGFLVCRGHAVTGTSSSRTGRVQFQFGDSEEVRSAVADFMADGQVPARQFSFEVLKLKKHLPKRQWRNWKNGHVQTTRAQ